MILFSTQMRKRLFFLQIFGLLIISILITWIFLAIKRPPALQSVWFIPHVAVYMFAYAAAGYTTVLAVLELLLYRKGHKEGTKDTNGKNLSALCENHCELRGKKINLFVTITATTLGLGLCFGALWAKKAWGQYWSWDIKETAALISWAIFLLCFHLQKLTKISRKLLLLLIIIGFLSINFTWYGVKFLPAAKKSPHTFYGVE